MMMMKNTVAHLTYLSEGRLKADIVKVKGYVNPGSVCDPGAPSGIKLDSFLMVPERSERGRAVVQVSIALMPRATTSSYTLHFTGPLIRPATGTHAIDLLLGRAPGPAPESCINHGNNSGVFGANGLLPKL